MTLLGAYNFAEDSGDVLDVTGNGHTITLGTGVRVAGHTGSALQVSNSAPPGIPHGTPFGQTAARTVMCWYRYASSPGGGWGIEWHNNSGNTGTWGLHFGTGTVEARGRNASATGIASTTAPSNGVWHHYAGTYDGSNVRLYVDGTLANTAALAGPLRTDADLLWLLDSVPANAHTIGDVRVLDEALDQATIATLMDTPVAPPAGETITGQLAASLPTFTGQLTVRSVVRAGLAAQLPAFVGSFDASTGITGLLGAALPAMTGSGAARVTVRGLLDATMPEFVSSVRDGPVTFTLHPGPPRTELTAGPPLVELSAGPPRGDAT